MLGEDAKNVPSARKLWMSHIASGGVDMPEYNVYCPAMKRMVKIQGTLKPNPETVAYTHGDPLPTGILTLHIEQCLFENSCPEKNEPNCVLHHYLEGQW